MFKKCMIMALSLISQAFSDPLVPLSIVEGYLKGYTEKEIVLIKKDLAVIKDLMMSEKEPAPEGSLVYLATIGGPGALKSTILERHLGENHSFVFCDPDQGALKNMVHTYLKEFSLVNRALMSDSDISKQAYEKWRGASNYISNKLLNEAFEGHYNIAHGTTSQGTPIASYNKLKDAQYKIHFLLCASSDDNRVAAIEHRVNAQHFYQSNPEDARHKADAIYKRLKDYFDVCDQLDLYWSDAFKEGSKLAAHWENRTLTIINPEAYKAFKEDYNSRKVSLNLKDFDEILSQ